MHILGAAKASLSKIAHSLGGAKVWNCVKFQYITRGLAGVAVRPLPTKLERKCKRAASQRECIAAILLELG